MTPDSPTPLNQIHAIADLVRDRTIVVLTGAGCSTESGIPDYRGSETRERARDPIQHIAFVTHAHVRARYWARSMLGWPLLRAARPNAAHFAIADLESAGAVNAVITQNVDRLHHAAGSRNIVELHGALADVVCLACGAWASRDDLQQRLLALNPTFSYSVGESAPDGDVDLADQAISAFSVPSCLVCGGVLKPQVVFFGGNVPRAIVDRGLTLVDGAQAMLVVGTSLAVFSVSIRSPGCRT